jgi:hypothetical protein
MSEDTADPEWETCLERETFLQYCDELYDLNPTDSSKAEYIRRCEIRFDEEKLGDIKFKYHEMEDMLDRVCTRINMYTEEDTKKMGIESLRAENKITVQINLTRFTQTARIIKSWESKIYPLDNNMTILIDMINDIPGYEISEDGNYIVITSEAKDSKNWLLLWGEILAVAQ